MSRGLLGLLIAGFLSGCDSPENSGVQKIEHAWSLEKMLDSADVWIESGIDDARSSRKVRYKLGRVGGVARASILQHATSTITFTDLRLGKNPRARFFIAIREEALAKGSDGARFSVSVTHDGRKQEVYQRFLDPAGSPSDRGWVRQEVPLAEFADRRIDVVLRVDPGPGGNPSYDQAYWGEPDIVSEATDSRRLPNVVLVSFDTLRADYLGVYGYPREISGNIDALASSGAVFDSCISQSSWTRPSHFSMLASRYPGRNLLFYDEKHCRVPAETVTLAESLKENDYLTAAFTGGGYVGRKSGFDQGFDYFRSYGSRFEEARRPMLDWLDDHGQSRFFLFLHNYNAHIPYDSPEDARARFVSDPPAACQGVTFSTPDIESGRAPDCLKDPGSQSYLKGSYAAEVFHVDRLFGDLVSRFEQLGILEHTLFVLTSDHGEGLLDHGEAFHITAAHQELIRVPLIFAGPGVPPGARIEETVRVMDIAPTLLALLDLPIPEAFQGRSLAPLLRGSELPPLHSFSASSWDESLDLARSKPHHVTAAVLGGGKKMIRNIGASVDVAELYDVTEDPRELKNLDGSDPPWGRDLDAALRAWLRELSTRTDCEPVSMDPAGMEELRALGYLQ